MLKYYLFGLLFGLTVTVSFAQDITCEPDKTLPDSFIGVYPLPFNPDRELDVGGITDPVCQLGKFEFTFTLAIPDTFAVATTTVKVESFSMSPVAAVSNLPEGMQYVCNPPNCVFLADSLGCILLFGTPAASVDTGLYNLEINGQVNAKIGNAIVPFPITFPDSALFNAGNYFLEVLDAADPRCIPSSTSEPFANQLHLKNTPNPFGAFTTIEIASKLSGEFQLQVFDLLGRLEHKQRINLFPGDNTINFDGSTLPNGIYVYVITDGFRAVSNKMVVHR